MSKETATKETKLLTAENAFTMYKSGHQIKKSHFIEGLKGKKMKEGWREYYTFLASVYAHKAMAVMKEKTPEEKIDEQIARLMKKKEALKK